MFFDAQKILEASRFSLKSGDEESLAAIRGFFPEIRTNERAELAIAFIKRLPTPLEQSKILEKLSRLATEADSRISDFRWWTIDPKELWLLANVFRDDREIYICLIWNNVEKGKTSSILPPWRGSSWARDTEAPGGWRYQFQSSEYHDAVSLYAGWLKAPLPPNRHAQPSKTG